MQKMNKLQYLLVPLLVLHTTTDVVGQDNWECLSPCKCKWVSGKKTAECIRQELIQIPSFLSSEIQYLDLTENPIVHLHEYAFSQVNLVNLQKLTLKQCNIETIDKKAFKGLKIVIEIDLSGNALKYIHPGTFVDTHRLRVLLLNDNHLDTLDNGLFHNLTYLQKVDLSTNRIQRIGEESFQKLPGLQTLLLHGNNISDVKLITFEKLPKLGSLELHNNPWNCNCLLKELRDWTIKKKLYTKQTTCKYPSHLTGKKWDEVSSDEFACQPRIQTIIPSSRQVQVEKGKSVRLDCLAAGIPQPRIHWVHRSRILNNSTRRHTSGSVTGNGVASETIGYIVTENIDVRGWVNLTVTNVTSADKGEYVCIAQSPGGTVEENVTLIISGDAFSNKEGGFSHHIISLPVALGLGVALLLFILVTMTLCVLYCRRQQATLLSDKKGHHEITVGGGGVDDHNDSLDQQGFGELEKSLITSVNPIGGDVTTTSIVVKPVRRYDTPSITSHGTEMTELNRTLLDNDSIFADGVGRIIANGMEDINDDDDDDEDNNERLRRMTPELESGTAFHGTSHYGNNSFNSRQYPPDLLAFPGGRGSSPTSQASTAPDNSRLFNQYLFGQFGGSSSSPQYVSGGSGFKTLPHNRSGTPYSSTGGGNNSIIPPLSRQGYVTIPRRPRAPSWSSGPPISPIEIDAIEPVYDNLGRRTTADGSSVVSLNKSPELIGLNASRGSDGCSRTIPVSPSIVLNNTIQHCTPNVHTNNNNNNNKFIITTNNNSCSQNDSDNDHVNRNNDNITSLDRSAPEGASEWPMQLADTVENCHALHQQQQTEVIPLEKKIPPRPPPKPKKKQANGPLYEDEGEDGTEV